MDREEALALVRELIKNENLVRHHLAVEAVMRRLARDQEGDPETWALVGLLHDADYELTGHDPETHGRVMAEKLEGHGVDPVIIEGVMAHNAALGIPRDSSLKKAIYACDELTGLIVAAALVHPERKLEALDVPFVMRRFGEKAFARGANRDQIKTCSELGYKLEDFVCIALEAMQDVSDELGL